MYSVYKSRWVFGIPRSGPETSYYYVKDMAYISLSEEKYKSAFNSSLSNLTNAFISQNNVIYQIQFHNKLTTVYQISFTETKEKIEEFLVWLNKFIPFHT